MPCSDSSSSMFIKLDPDEKFVLFQYAKITCGSEISGGTGYSQYCAGKTLEEILALSFQDVVKDLNVQEEENQYVLYLEWDVLRSAIVQYLGIEDDTIDMNRCKISSVDVTDQGIEISEIVLPPAQMPKITACGVKNNST